MKYTHFIAATLFCLSCSQIKITTSENKNGGEPQEEINFDGGEEVVKINDQSVKQGFLDALANINPRVKAQLENPVARQKLLDNLVEQELLYQESLKRGLNLNTAVRQKTAIYKKVIIAQALLEQELDRKASEYYEQKKEAEFTRVGLSQIFIKLEQPEEKENEDQQQKKEPPTEEDKKKALEAAGAVVARLKGGEDFAKVAEEVSDDKGSKRKGGDIGKISREDKRLARKGLEAAAKLAFELKEGEISEPVEGKNGYYIFKVTSAPEVVPFDEAKQVILFQIQQETRDNLVAQLKSNAKIVFPEVKPAEAEQQTAPQPTEPEMIKPQGEAGEQIEPQQPQQTEPAPQAGEPEATEEKAPQPTEQPNQPEAAPSEPTKVEEEKPQVYFQEGTHTKFEEKE